MILRIKLNEQEQHILSHLLRAGIYGLSPEQIVTRILDEALEEKWVGALGRDLGALTKLKTEKPTPKDSRGKVIQHPSTGIRLAEKLTRKKS